MKKGKPPLRVSLPRRSAEMDALLPRGSPRLPVSHSTFASPSSVPRSPPPTEEAAPIPHGFSRRRSPPPAAAAPHLRSPLPRDSTLPIAASHRRLAPAPCSGCRDPTAAPHDRLHLRPRRVSAPMCAGFAQETPISRHQRTTSAPSVLFFVDASAMYQAFLSAVSCGKPPTLSRVSIYRSFLHKKPPYGNPAASSSHPRAKQPLPRSARRPPRPPRRARRPYPAPVDGALPPPNSLFSSPLGNIAATVSQRLGYGAAKRRARE